MSGERRSADPLLEATSALGWLSAWIPERGCPWVALCIDSGCLVYIYLCSAKSLGFRFPRPKFKFWLSLLLLAKLLFLSVSWPLYVLYGNNSTTFLYYCFKRYWTWMPSEGCEGLPRTVLVTMDTGHRAEMWGSGCRCWREGSWTVGFRLSARLFWMEAVLLQGTSPDFMSEISLWCLACSHYLTQGAWWTLKNTRLPLPGSAPSLNKEGLLGSVHRFLLEGGGFSGASYLVKGCSLTLGLPRVPSSVPVVRRDTSAPGNEGGGWGPSRCWRDPASASS